MRGYLKVGSSIYHKSATSFMLNFILMHPTVTLEYFSETVKSQSHINSSIIAHATLLCCHKDCLNNCFEKSEGPLDMGNQTDLIEYSDN